MIVFFPSLSQLKFLGFSIVENITKRVCMFASWKGKSMCVYTHTTHNQWIMCELVDVVCDCVSVNSVV